MLYSINLYGLAAVAVLLALYGIAVLGTRGSSWALAIFAGCEVVSVLPAHIAICDPGGRRYRDRLGSAHGVRACR